MAATNDPYLNSIYQQYLGRTPDAEGLNYWENQIANGTLDSAGAAWNIENSPEAQKYQQQKSLFSLGNASAVPDYSKIAQQQYDLNKQNAESQMWMNNPNQYGPGGSQVRTKNPDGTYSVTTSLSPQLQENYDAQNALQGNILGRANNLVGSQLDYSGAPSAPVADAEDLAKTRDAVYQQQTQYLDPQFQQAQSDLDSRLANQGIMPGSEAYNREMNNFSLTKQKAYGDARNSAIQAGGQEQSRLFGIGMQGRQQGISEANTLHNSPLNDLASLRTGSQISLPTYSPGVGTSIPGVDILNAANMGYNANLGISNANAASNANTMNGLFGLGSAAIQNPGAISSAWNWMTG
jgi:hypothetical protein